MNFILAQSSRYSQCTISTHAQQANIIITYPNNIRRSVSTLLPDKASGLRRRWRLLSLFPVARLFAKGERTCTCSISMFREENSRKTNFRNAPSRFRENLDRVSMRIDHFGSTANERSLLDHSVPEKKTNLLLQTSADSDACVYAISSPSLFSILSNFDFFVVTVSRYSSVIIAGIVHRSIHTLLHEKGDNPNELMITKSESGAKVIKTCDRKAERNRK